MTSGVSATHTAAPTVLTKCMIYMIKTCFKSHLNNLKINIYSAFEISEIFFSRNGAVMLFKKEKKEIIETSGPHLLQVCFSCCHGQVFCPAF